MSEQLTFHIASTTFVTGLGTIEKITDFTSEYRVNKVMVVTDEKIKELSIFRKMIDQLEEYHIQYTVFSGITPNPKDSEIMDGSSAFKAEECDAIIGIGGGSVMDAAKAISGIVLNDGFIMDYGRSNPNKKAFVNGRVRLALIPTTSGTGSEISPHAVITNTKLRKKSDIQEKIFYPDYVVMDSSVLMSLPENITADTGVDALTHAVEAFTNKKMTYLSSPLHDAIGLEAIKLVNENLRRAFYSGDVDLTARENMQWAAMLAGFVLDLDAAAVHGLSGFLQTKYSDMTHGQSVGMMLPTVMEFNMVSCPDRFRKVSEALGVDTKSMTDMQAARAGVAVVRELLSDLNFAKLQDFMDDPAEIEDFIETAANNSMLKNNPRKMTVEDVRQVFLDVYNENYS
ncbi:iron-containing alcohol dehydrogenase [Enterococcus sp. DIV0187]|uniref:iron-containing alcohol dehydrogenase n=1 Tax=Enterococcus sp. DIV0187 TaxID=2774644 RepID=UPI003F21483B